MNLQELFSLYMKERSYQEAVFGSYSKNTALNLASFLQFIEETTDKAKKGYVGAWAKNLPPWLLDCEEYKQGTAPVATYEYLIKVFVLAGAALESYANVDVEKWRDDGIKNKWKEENRE